MSDAWPADLRWLPHVIRTAAAGTGRYMHGAALYRSGRLLQLARNRSRVQDAWILDRPREQCSTHAEVAATRGRDCAGASLLVIRINRAGDLRPSRPCPACAHALDAAGIRKVVYS